MDEIVRCFLAFILGLEKVLDERSTKILRVAETMFMKMMDIDETYGKTGSSPLRCTRL